VGATFIRVDSGVREGDAITPHYDPMIAKLIAWGETREQARQRLRQALAETRIAGLHTNAQFLHRLLGLPEFVDGAVDTGLIARHQDVLLATPAIPLHAACAAAVAALLHGEQALQTADPWSVRDGFIPGLAQQRTLHFDSPWGALACVLHYAGAGQPQRLKAPGLAAPEVFASTGQDLGAGETAVDLTLGPLRLRAHVVRIGAPALAFAHTPPRGASPPGGGPAAARGSRGLQVFVGGEQVLLQLQSADHGAGDDASAGGRLTAPMPGKVIAVNVQPGDEVEAGQPLLVMEAMKMEHTMTAPAAGRVAEMLYAVGDLVAEGAELLRLEVVLAVEAGAQENAGPPQVFLTPSGGGQVGRPRGHI
jgi:3-methylcrotonyl-CoA carboxylase alpha subunit